MFQIVLKLQFSMNNNCWYKKMKIPYCFLEKKRPLPRSLNISQTRRGGHGPMPPLLYTPLNGADKQARLQLYGRKFLGGGDFNPRLACIDTTLWQGGYLTSLPFEAPAVCPGRLEGGCACCAVVTEVQTLRTRGYIRNRVVILMWKLTNILE